MDPGTALAVVGLAGQLFSASLEGYRILSTIKSLETDYGDLSFKLQHEKTMLSDWGSYWLNDDPPRLRRDRKRGHALEALARIALLFADLEAFEVKYGIIKETGYYYKPESSSPSTSLKVLSSEPKRRRSFRAFLRSEDTKTSAPRPQFPEVQQDWDPCLQVLQCRACTAPTIATEKYGYIDGEVPAVALSPGGELVASASVSPDTRILLWDVATGEPRGTLEAHMNRITNLVFSCNDLKLLASASADCTARIWNSATGDLQRTLEHGDKVTDVVSSVDGQFLATNCDDCHIRIWDWVTGTLQRQLRKGRFPRKGMAFLASGDLITYNSFGVNYCSPPSMQLLFKQWDLETGHIRMESQMDLPSGLSPVATSPDGHCS